jgi:hypothetical protein
VPWRRRESCPDRSPACRDADPARAPAGAHVRDAGKHRVGSLGRFDGERPAGADDNGLPRVEARERLEQVLAEGNIGLVVRRDAAAAKRSNRRDEAGRDFMRPDNVDAFALDDLSKADQEAVVATAKQLCKFAGALHRSPVEPQIGEIGARHRADDHHLADRALLQRGEQLADLAHTQPDVRIVFDPRFRRAHHADQERRPPGPARVRRHFQRERAGAAQDRQGRG